MLYECTTDNHFISSLVMQGHLEPWLIAHQYGTYQRRCDMQCFLISFPIFQSCMPEVFLYLVKPFSYHSPLLYSLLLLPLPDILHLAVLPIKIPKTTLGLLVLPCQLWIHMHSLLQYYLLWPISHIVLDLLYSLGLLSRILYQPNMYFT